MADPAELSRLSSQLGFTLAELELNRIGRLSDAQSWSALRGTAVALGLMSLAIGALFLMLGVKVPTVLRVVWTVFLVPGLGIMFYFCGPLFLGYVQRRVATSEGYPNFRGGSRGPPSLYIGKARVSAPPNARKALSDGTQYRLYYIARTDQFLSIEPL